MTAGHRSAGLHVPGLAQWPGNAVHEPRPTHVSPAGQLALFTQVVLVVVEHLPTHDPGAPPQSASVVHSVVSPGRHALLAWHWAVPLPLQLTGAPPSMIST